LYGLWVVTEPVALEGPWTVSPPFGLGLSGLVLSLMEVIEKAYNWGVLCFEFRGSFISFRIKHFDPIQMSINNMSSFFSFRGEIDIVYKV
jgi:hypothetical protein